MDSLGWICMASLPFDYMERQCIEGFRSPTIRELFMWNPNPNLKPEKIVSYEEQGLSNRFKQESKLNIELTGFYIKGTI